VEELSKPEESVEDVLKKIREEMKRKIEEASKIAASAQQTILQLSKLSEELKKTAMELSKPPKTALPEKKT
jgi:cell division septum initiation protein DivIVA